MSRTTKEPTAGLVARIESGDRQAESELIQRFSRGVLAMLRQRTADWDLAADIHQDTFVVVIERLRKGELDHPERLAAFIRQTAVNIHLGALRKRRRRATDPDSERVALAADQNAGPVARLETREARELVRRLIDEMRIDRDRQMLRRFYISEESKPSICQDLDLDSAHFDRVLHRARQRLRELLQQHLSLGGGTC